MPALKTSADYLELAYGILWIAPTDKATPAGIAIANTRQIILDELDRDAKIRGVMRAQRIVAGERMSSETH